MSDMNETTTVTDRLGRVLEIRDLDALEEMDLMEAAADAAMNNRWWINAVMYACVRKIDGQPQPFPRKKALIKAHIAAVGQAGIKAVSDLRIEQLPPAVRAELLGEDAPPSSELTAEVQTAKN